jgi:RNA polymerase sigma-70 factor (ECF subfamily)
VEAGEIGLRATPILTSSQLPDRLNVDSRMAEPVPSDAGRSESAEQDLELLHQAGQGNLAAFEALVHRLLPRVSGLARRILGPGPDAEEVTQETFLSLLEHLDQFRGDSSVATWVLRIATNHALQVLRKRRGLTVVPLEVTAPDQDSGDTPLPHPDYIAQWRDNPEDLAQQAEVRQILEQALAELDEKYRIVFVLRDIEGFSVKETAEMLGLSEANVKVRLLRARLQLRERLTRIFGDEATRVWPSHAH